MSRVAGRTARRIRDRLVARGWQLGLIETLTGGAIADRLTDVPGSSAYFAGSLNVPRLDRLGAWLPSGVPPGDPEAVAAAAAAWIRVELSVDLGVAVVAEAAPVGSLPGLPVAIVLAGPDLSARRIYRPRGTGAEWQASVSRAAIDLIDRSLAGEGAAPSSH